jgi:phenylacetate-CoA ligase
VFVAYAQAAVLFARFIRERGMSDIHFDSIITTAEVCSPHDRSFIEETFRGKVFNRYGCREVSTIAAECEFHSGLHVSAESLLVEIVPAEHTPPGMGKIIVTDLLNRSFPLIRYEIGDVGSWAEDQSCLCGRGLPLISRLEGRITDFLTLRDGRKLSGVALLTWVFAAMDEVRQVQFVQHGIGDLTLRYVAGPAFNADTERHLHERLQPFLQGQADLALVRVADIAKEPSGKFRFIVHAPRGAADPRKGAVAL